MEFEAFSKKNWYGLVNSISIKPDTNGGIHDHMSEGISFVVSLS